MQRNKEKKWNINILTCIYLVVIITIIIKYTINNFGKYGFYENYLIDFKVGFLSRALIGSLIDFFYKIPLSKADAANFSFWSSLITNIFLFLFLFYILLKTNTKNQWKLFSIIVLFLIIPNLYHFYFIQMYGWLDIFWFLSFFICILFLKNKYLIYFIPLICFLGIAIHYVFFIMILPSILLIQYYEMVNNNFSLKYILSLVSNFIISLLSSVYFFFFAKFTVKLTQAEFINYILSKYSYSPEPLYKYYWKGFYLGYCNKLPITVFMNYISNNYPPKINLMIIFKTSILLFIFILIVWLISLIKSKTIFHMIFFISLLLLPIFTSIIFLFGTDIGRWVYSYLTVQFLVFLYLLHYNNTDFSKLFLNSKLFYFCLFYLLIALNVSLKNGGASIF